MTRRSYSLVYSALLTLAATLPLHAYGAAVTKQVYVTFDGTLTGVAYTLGAGEIDNSFTFTGNGSVTISAGVADIPGNVDFSSGFLFSGADLVAEESLGSLQTTNWITEAVIRLDVPVADQPDGPAPGDNDNYNHFLDVQGDTFYRFNGDDHLPKDTDFGYWNGSTQPGLTVSNPPVDHWVHVALVWTAGTNTLEAFLGGVSQGAVNSGSPFDVSNPNVGYGFFSRFLNRSMDGKLDSVAFSTYTGTFAAPTDFQLPVLAVPEPSTTALALMGFAVVARVRRKK
jgi:hypothetical protein